MSRPRKWGWPQQWNAQHGRCWICLKPMKLKAGLHPLAASVEHIVPKARGGGERWHNKLLAHRCCNSARGAPFIWIPVRVFRHAVIARFDGLLRETTVEGVDLGCSYPLGAPKRSATTRRLVTMPSEMASTALRVTLGELSSIRPQVCHPPPQSPAPDAL